MKTRLVKVWGLNLEISLYNNTLVLFCDMNGYGYYESRRIIRNSILTESEIIGRIDSEWVCKVFSKNLKQIMNVIHSNVSIIPHMNQQKSANYDKDDAISSFRLM